MRGNVLTRLEKLDHGEYGALVLASAGLRRLGLEHRISRYFSPDELLPAAGQGVLAVQCRAGWDTGFLQCVHHQATAAAVAANGRLSKRWTVAAVPRWRLTLRWKTAW